MATQAQTRTARIVLVPGFWLGGWAWDAVAARLRELGHDVTALTLPGLEPEHPARGSVTLEEHVRAIEAALDGEGEVVLVASRTAARRFPPRSRSIATSSASRARSGSTPRPSSTGRRWMRHSRATS